MIDLTTSGAT